MQLVSYLAQNYFATPFERFTERIVRALALFKVIEAPNKEDYEFIKFVEENTDKKLRVSIYKLDRIVNPSKGQFNVVDNKARFIRNGLENCENDSEKYVELTEQEIHGAMCVAMRKVNDIVAKNLRDYSIEMKLPKDDFLEGTEGWE